MAPLFTQDPSIPEVPFSSYTPHVAIITGSSQGIGREIAHKLADDGIDIAINDIASKQKQIDTVVDEMRKKGRKAIAIPGDVSKEEDVISIVEKTARELGSVDIMIANAGIAPVGAFLETDGKTFDAVYQVNIRGVFFCLKHAALQMIKQGRGGRLIAASSSAGKIGTQNLVAYSAAKFAVRGIIQTAAIELRRHGITANAYAPGFIHTALAIRPDGVDDNCATVKKWFGAPPEAPVAKADTVASVVSYLVKPDAFFINGQSINVDGGYRYD